VPIVVAHVFGEPPSSRHFVSFSVTGVDAHATIGAGEVPPPSDGRVAGSGLLVASVVPHATTTSIAPTAIRMRHYDMTELVRSEPGSCITFTHKEVFVMAAKSGRAWKVERASVRRGGRATSNKYRSSDADEKPTANSRSRVWVGGYTRSDGIRVSGHYRAA
jgi:hypothetical protein